MKFNRYYLLIIPLFIFIVYGNSLNNSFHRDDVVQIVYNRYITDFCYLPKLFSREYFVLFGEFTYRPVSIFSLFVDNFLYQKVFHIQGATGYRLTNIFLHIANALLICYFVFLVTRNQFISLLVALLFGIHPVFTSYINYVTLDREGLISFLFFMVAFLFYIRNKIFLSSVSFIVALFSKEMAITLPIVLILYDYIYQESKKIDFRRYISYFVIAGLFVVFKFVLFPPTGIVRGTDLAKGFDYPGKSMPRTLLNIPGFIMYYWKILLFPYKLTIDSDRYFHLASSVFNPGVVISTLLVVLMLIVSFKIKKQHKDISFSLLYFLITLLPVLNIVPFGGIVQESYVYFSSVGYFFWGGINWKDTEQNIAVGSNYFVGRALFGKNNCPES